MIFTYVRHAADPLTLEPLGLKAVVDDTVMFVPLDPANRHYAEIMRQVEAGELVIQPAEEPNQ